MITARIEFKPGHGSYFCPGGEQDIIELKFETVSAIIGTLRDLGEDVVHSCTTLQSDGTVLNFLNVHGFD